MKPSESGKRLSVAQYAAHRGVSREAVYQALRAGKLPGVDRRAIDPDAADELWVSNTPRGHGPAGKEAALRALQAAAKSHTEINGGQNISLVQIKAAHEAVRMDRTKLALARERSTLIERDEVSRLFQEAMVVIASQMDALGARFAADLAAMDNPAEIQQFLLRETRRIRAAAAEKLAGLGG